MLVKNSLIFSLMACSLVSLYILFCNSRTANKNGSTIKPLDLEIGRKSENSHTDIDYAAKDSNKSEVERQNLRQDQSYLKIDLESYTEDISTLKEKLICDSQDQTTTIETEVDSVVKETDTSFEITDIEKDYISSLDHSQDSKKRKKNLIHNFTPAISKDDTFDIEDLRGTKEPLDSTEIKELNPLASDPCLIDDTELQHINDIKNNQSECVTVAPKIEKLTDDLKHIRKNINECDLSNQNKGVNKDDSDIAEVAVGINNQKSHISNDTKSIIILSDSDIKIADSIENKNNKEISPKGTNPIDLNNKAMPGEKKIDYLKTSNLSINNRSFGSVFYSSVLNKPQPVNIMEQLKNSPGIKVKFDTEKLAKIAFGVKNSNTVTEKVKDKNRFMSEELDYK